MFLTFASCDQKYTALNGQCWGTSYHITYDGPATLADSVELEIALINDEFSLYNPSSTVSAINDNKLDSVGPRFAELFAIAKDVHSWSGGEYDITVGPLCEIWGFGKGEINSTPSDSLIAETLQSVGLEACSIANGRIIKKSPATRFDFSSLAKGYGVDKVAEMLRRNGVVNYMVEIGGEVAVKGLNPKGEPWRIQIDSPLGGMAHERLTIVALGPQEEALASSGNYRNFRTDSAGCLYGHTISPTQGRPVTGHVIAVSVAAPNCALADALATACMAVGDIDKAAEVLNRAGVGGLVTESVGDGELKSKAIGYFDEKVRDDSGQR